MFLLCSDTRPQRGLVFILIDHGDRVALSDVNVLYNCLYSTGNSQGVSVSNQLAPSSTGAWLIRTRLDPRYQGLLFSFSQVS